VPASKHSAGLLVYRRAGGSGSAELEVLLAHMGGPFWAGREEGAWSLPKGELIPGEDELEAAKREFEEEIGQPAPAGEPVLLGSVRQSGGKLVTGFALEGDLDVTTVRSNLVEMEWPRRSGRFITFPEVDKAGWFAVERARKRVVKGQAPLLDRLVELLGG
jgi:predicted NUDIX family NTP pyrophosphohydrolase